MYARQIKVVNWRWATLVWPSRHSNRPFCGGRVSFRSLSFTSALKDYHRPHSCSYLLDSFLSRGIRRENNSAGLASGPNAFWKCSQFCLYSSKGDGRNTSEDKHATVKGGASFDDGKTQQGSTREDVECCDAHARLAEQDQKEWLNNERLAMESRKKDSPFLTRRDKFKSDFLRRVIPWEKIHVSWEKFPYYIDQHAKNTLVECATAHLKQKQLTALYGARLTSSSGRIMLQSIPGSELYRERIVRALAHDLQVPLLVLDSSILAPYDFSDDYSSECESDDNVESGEESTSELEVEEENEPTNEEDWTSSHETRSDSTDDDAIDVRADDINDVRARAEAALKKLVPFIENFEKRVYGEPDSSSESSKSEAAKPADKSEQPLKKGDRVKYTGPSVHTEAPNRIMLGKMSTSDGLKNAYTVIRGRDLSAGQRGEVYEVKGDQVAVVFDIAKDSKATKGENEEKVTEPPVYWVHVKEIELDPNAEAEDFYVAIEALSEVLDSMQPLIVYFPDSSLWLSKAIPNSKDFVQKTREMFDQLSGPVVLICGQNKVEMGSKEREKFTMILPGLGRMAKLPLPLNRLTDGLKATKTSDDGELHKLFNNVLCINPPKEEDLLRTFSKQIEEDRRIVASRSNLNELQKVLEENEMSCLELLNVNTDGIILTKRKAEMIVGWAKNYYLSNCTLPSVKGECLILPRESLEIAILRLKEQESISRKQSQNLKDLAKDEYENNFVSAVVPPGEIGVKFDDIGALEDVKKALNELVILPMRRPELFSRGNLLRPCKGILLFGPPGTGKTLLAKALATEAGANFISITGSTLTSKWFGDAEKLTKALFSFSSKLAPVIIFVDEVDGLLGARGGASEHEATRRMRNEFMAAWDGLRSKESQRILILGATNRPFDLDDAVIRRLPRRIYVDLPDAENRLKILRIILAQENLEPNFQYEKLANVTEGYSGSDLKNLSIAAAYRPVQELLEVEKKGGKNDLARSLRPLNLDDFIQSKAKVSPSVAYDATSMNELRKWNEQYGEGGSRRRSPFGFGDK